MLFCVELSGGMYVCGMCGDMLCCMVLQCNMNIRICIYRLGGCVYIVAYGVVCCCGDIV